MSKSLQSPSFRPHQSTHNRTGSEIGCLSCVETVCEWSPARLFQWFPKDPTSQGEFPGDRKTSPAPTQVALPFYGCGWKADEEGVHRNMSQACKWFVYLLTVLEEGRGETAHSCFLMSGYCSQSHANPHSSLRAVCRGEGIRVWPNSGHTAGCMSRLLPVMKNTSDFQQWKKYAELSLQLKKGKRGCISQ